MNRYRKYRREIFQEPDLPAREEKIQQTIQASMNQFISVLAQEPMDLWEFIYCQSRYIKKRWWLIQALLLVFLYHHISVLQEPVMIRQTLGVGAPLFIILVIPELWRNQSSHAMDIESATMYTLQQLYAARLTLFAGVDLLLLTTFCLGATTSHALTLWDILIQFILPVNVTCCICLTCLYTPRAGHQAFSLALCLAFAGLWKEIVSSENVYHAITVPAWACMLAISLAYMAFCVFRGQRRWRKNMEVKLLWS